MKNQILKFNNRDGPKVSILILCHNQVDVTKKCISSVCRFSTDVSAELIIILNGCTRTSIDELTSYVDGAKFIINDQNLGFGEAYNQAVLEASGEFLFFLNNDTEICEDSIKVLSEVFHNPKVGAAGSMLLYPDGNIQEVGGRVFCDGSASNIGRYDSIENPKYHFVRKVDYCSGAALMVRSELFDRLRGFDKIYSPAYYEDTDLCMGISSLGYDVVVCPESRVFHIEGQSAGRDENGSGWKKYQPRNKEFFLKKWKDILRDYQDHNNDFDQLLHHPQKYKKRVLVIDFLVPDPTRDSGSLREYRLMSLLSQIGYYVTFIGCTSHFEQKADGNKKYVKDLQKLGIEVRYDITSDSIEEFINSRPSFYDYTILTRAEVAGLYLDEVKRANPNTKIVFDTVDLHFLREEREASIEKHFGKKLSATKTKALELDVARKADRVWVVASYEKDFLKDYMSKDNIDIISNVHDLYRDRETSFEKREGLLFVGHFAHRPNVDSIKWFYHEIWPLIREMNGQIKCSIVGRSVPDEIRLMHSDSFQIIGPVDDLSDYYSRFRLSLAPLRFGAGVKGKILESLAYGVPVVSTSIGAESLYVEDGKNIFIGDDPLHFAQKVCTLYEDRDLWNKMALGGRKIVDDHFSSQVMKQKIEQILI